MTELFDGGDTIKHRSSPYRIREPHIAHEEIDGEVIAMNFETGTYFSLRGAAAIAWQHLGQSASIATLLRVLRAESSRQVEEVEQFVGRLVEEGLIASVEGEEPASPASSNESIAAYDPPVLEAFTDMQELLLADPLHEVDEEGWPRLSSDENDAER